MAEKLDIKLGVIGAGNMAEALIRGVTGSGLVEAGNIYACDPSEARQKCFADIGCNVSGANDDALSCDVVLLSVKPQMFDAVVGDAGKKMSGSKTVISIAAGVRTGRIASLVPDGTKIVRVMPNTPMLAGRGVSGVAAGPNASDADVDMVLKLFASAGVAMKVEEEMIDAVTALSGSGPAYVFRFVELLAEAGKSMGLGPEAAMSMARETVIGSAMLLDQSGESASDLRVKVTSPGGTTEAALNVFNENNNFGELVKNALDAAKSRSIELAGS